MYKNEEKTLFLLIWTVFCRFVVFGLEPQNFVKFSGFCLILSASAECSGSCRFLSNFLQLCIILQIFFPKKYFYTFIIFFFLKNVFIFFFLQNVFIIFFFQKYFYTFIIFFFQKIFFILLQSYMPCIINFCMLV